MLKQGYRYISLDCETTGLDTHRDEIIQIALVEYDHTLTIQETFCSFVRPRDPSKLKHII
jgi:DNA polymerase III epsilon subunit-like protein